MEDAHLALRFAVAIGLGILLGFERERTKSEEGGAGVRLLCVASLGACYWLWQRRKRHERGEVKSGSNPFELDAAIKFGLLFAVVVLIAKAAQVYLGDAGLYLAAGIAGLTDVDAITLAMANLAHDDTSNLQVASRAIVIAVMANTMTKSGMAIGLGSSDRRRITLPIAVLLLVTGTLGAFLL